MQKASGHSAHLIVIEIADGMFIPRLHDLPSGAVKRRAALRRITTHPQSLEELLVWVSTDKTEGAVRINEVLELITELVKLSRGRGDAQEHLLVLQGRVYNVRSNLPRGRYLRSTDRERRLRVELHEKLARYWVTPRYMATAGDYPIFGWWSGSTSRDAEGSFTEYDAILTILDLSRAGLLHKVQRCQHCSNWFLARFTRQRFCRVACQQKFFRSSDEYKEQRRAYVKKMREEDKKRKVIKQQVKRSNSPSKYKWKK